MRLLYTSGSIYGETFQFTHPGKGATLTDPSLSPAEKGFNSRTLGRVRLFMHKCNRGISSFNSRTLGRVRLDLRLLALSGLMFQFTHPGKGATWLYIRTTKRPRRFNSRTLGRVRQANVATMAQSILVSIHAPWEGCDIILQTTCIAHMFQFTHPGKGATQGRNVPSQKSQVSIHAPWEGCDSVVQSCVL